MGRLTPFCHGRALQGLPRSPSEPDRRACRTVSLGARQLIGEGKIRPDAVLGKGVELEAEILVIRANAGVSNTSPALRRRVHGSALGCRSR